MDYRVALLLSSPLLVLELQHRHRPHAQTCEPLHQRPRISVLRLTSTRLPTRWTLSVSAGRTQDWKSLASLRRGMKMPMTFRFVACALPVCRCWSVLVPFGRGREPMDVFY